MSVPMPLRRVTCLLAATTPSSSSANFSITPKSITVTADSGQSKVFGAVDPVFTYTSSESVTFTGDSAAMQARMSVSMPLRRVTSLLAATTPSPSSARTSTSRPKASRSRRTADRVRSLVLPIQSSPTLLPRVSPSQVHSAATQARMSVPMPSRRVTCLLVATHQSLVTTTPSPSSRPTSTSHQPLLQSH